MWLTNSWAAPISFGSVAIASPSFRSTLPRLGWALLGLQMPDWWWLLPSRSSPCLFCAGAAIHFVKRREGVARTWFFVGVLLTLVTFTFFSIGDHLFGDRFELLEHTLFWFVTLVSWVAFTRLKDVHLPALSPRKPVGVVVVAASLVLATSASIFRHNDRFFHRRTSAVEAVQVGDHLYKVSFPFLGGSTVFEESIRLFKETHPGETIDHIYTVPNPLRLKKADALIFYISTEAS